MFISKRNQGLALRSTKSQVLMSKSKKRLHSVTQDQRNPKMKSLKTVTI